MYPHNGHASAGFYKTNQQITMFIFRDIKQYHQDLTASSTTCADVVQFYLQQIDAKKKLNAFTEVFADEAIQHNPCHWDKNGEKTPNGFERTPFVPGENADQGEDEQNPIHQAENKENLFGDVLRVETDEICDYCSDGVTPEW